MKQHHACCCLARSKGQLQKAVHLMKGKKQIMLIQFMLHLTAFCVQAENALDYSE